MSSADSIEHILPLRWVGPAVLAFAAAGLAFEITLARVFSLIFQYHYVFLIISVAILGLGAGAGAGYLAQRLGLLVRVRVLMFSAFLTALAFPFVALLLANGPHALAAMIPFILLGWINALIYTQYGARSNFLYAVDLLGAALGLATMPILLAMFGPFGVIIAMGAVAGLGALSLAAATWPARGWIVMAIGLIIGFSVLTMVNQTIGFATYQPYVLVDAPRDKTMVHVLQNAPQQTEILATRWSAFAQIDVVDIDDPNMRYVFTDAGAGSYMVRYNPDAMDASSSGLAWIRGEPAYLPFATGPVSKTLVIGAGAGYDVLMATLAGAEAVTAVEINPAIVEITRAMSDFNGNILDLPHVNTIVTDGRNFVERSGAAFDLIYLNTVYSQAARPGVAALSESYAFTTEAFRAYWYRLTARGRIAFVVHNGVEGVRLLITALQALQEEGLSIPEALTHTALLIKPNQVDPTVSPNVLLVARVPWSEEDVQTLAKVAADRGMQSLFLPHIHQETMANLISGKSSLETYLNAPANREYNLFPTTDDRPFFYYLSPVLPQALENLLKLSFILTLGYFTIASLLQPRSPIHEWTRLDLNFYFALLGIGFMLVEVSLVQRFALLLGDPVLALGVVLGTLFTGGGLGSLFSARYSAAGLTRVVVLSALGVSVWGLGFAIFYPAFVSIVLPLDLFLRGAASALVLLPLGFAIGIPFPNGLRLAKQVDSGGVALFWGMNALASTFGTVLATVLALLAGFEVALWAGVGVYLSAAGLVYLTWQHVLYPHTGEI